MFEKAAMDFEKSLELDRNNEEALKYIQFIREDMEERKQATWKEKPRLKILEVVCSDDEE
jgi:hypothetical protein